MKRILIAANLKRSAPTSQPEVSDSSRFLTRVRAVGGIPAIGAALNESDADALAEAFDALILTGGRDVPPERYGAAPHKANGYDDPMRDASDEWLFHAFRKRGKRVLGVCRGCQAINVYMGGTLHQHLPEAFEPVLWHSGNLLGRHGVAVKDGTLLSSLIGAGATRINTSHHQAIDRPGEGLIISATAPDGVTEAAECENVLLIQWHPEYMDDEHDALFRWLVE